MEMTEIKGVTYSVEHYDQFRQTGDLNYFEEVIDMMVLDGIEGMNETFRNAICGLSRDKKRMTILSLLDKDLNLFKRIRALTDKNINKMDHIKDIILMLREYVKVGEVEKKKFGEVMTPLELVKEMLATLPEEVWSNPNLKWLDPANGTGPYPIMVIYKLMNGLKDWEPDDEKRYRHIVENMIYVCELQPKNMFLYMCAVDPFDKYELNIYTGSFLEDGFDKHMKEVWGVETFQISLGNPPYQKMDKGHSASAGPIYNLFVDKCLSISEKVIFIIPSRWFAGGKGLDDFRDRMMNSNNIKLIQHFGNNGQDIFGKEINIGGGVSYLLIDNNYNGLCSFNGKLVKLNKYDIVVRDIESYPLLDKIVSHIESLGSLQEIAKPRSFYGIATNDKRINDIQLDETYIKCFVSKHKGFIKFIKNDLDYDKVNLHKVATPRALGNPEDGLGNIFYVGNNEVVTDSYMFLSVSSKNEADSLISYLSSNFVHYLICLRKIDASIKPSTFKWIPQVPLDRVWTDELIYDFFDLSKSEQELIYKNKKND